MIAALFGLAFLGALIGGIQVLMVFFTSPISAPQQAAGAAMALACAVIPYIGARAVQISMHAKKREQDFSALYQKLTEIEDGLSSKKATISGAAD